MAYLSLAFLHSISVSKKSDRFSVVSISAVDP